MKKQAYIEERLDGWYVYTYVGGVQETLGPYLWEWLAALVCRLENSSIANKVL